jgi:hypothetical protein
MWLHRHFLWLLRGWHETLKGVTQTQEEDVETPSRRFETTIKFWRWMRTSFRTSSCSRWTLQPPEGTLSKVPTNVSMFIKTAHKRCDWLKYGPGPL